MPASLIALAAGLLFGLGLTVSGMIDPARVLGFLDVAGDWNPSLAFVLAGAVAVATMGFAIARHRATPLWAGSFRQPSRTGINARLLTGAVLFGLGWGMAGLCPGPALADLSLGLPKVWLFVAAMLVGMAVHDATVGAHRPVARHASS